MLSSAATKREAKSYLSRYNLDRPSVTKSQLATHYVGVNLGSLYLPIRSIDESPIFAQTPAQTRFRDKTNEPLHVALVKITGPQLLEDATLDGIGHTLSQLSRLGLNCIVVADLSRNEPDRLPLSLPKALEQTDRIAQAIDKHGRPGARRLDNVIGIAPLREESDASVKVRGAIRVINRNLILAPLRRGIIPVVAPMAFMADMQRLHTVSTDDVILALIRDLAGIQSNIFGDEEPLRIVESLTSLQKQVSLDRLIVLDPLGGIPSTKGVRRAHIFINLEQDYDGIRSDLLGSDHGTVQQADPTTSGDDRPDALALGTSFTGPWYDGRGPGVELEEGKPPIMSAITKCSHLQNLELVRNALGILPPTSSAILTSPQEAANPKSHVSTQSHGPRVATRRRRNPLIHNLLTDKPILSSSLPVRPHPPPNAVIGTAPATFVKRGMPVTIIPDPHVQPWGPPTASSPGIRLSDPSVDLARLIFLIEDSFNRKIDISDYLSRISNHIAGVIICGNYEGGAILTWESPFPDCSPELMVPYLDKFAVLRRSQGAGGVADIVFNAMVEDCFPAGVCWRSRKDNPVNKWYFERSKGTWKMPDSNWTMFWTTDDVEAGDERGLFGDYAKVCRNVVPSWADKKVVAD